MGLDSYLYSLPKRGFTYAQTIDVLRNCWEYDKKTTPDEKCKEAYADLYTDEYSVLKQWGYWRKAWDLHHLFVNSYQDGVDDCDIHKELHREDIIDIRNHVIEKLKDFEIPKGLVANAYRENEDGTTTIIPCDGIEVRYGDDSVRRFSVEHPVMVDIYFDDWEKMHYEDALEYCNDILVNFDFDNNYLFYVSSW